MILLVFILLIICAIILLNKGSGDMYGKGHQSVKNITFDEKNDYA